MDFLQQYMVVVVLLNANRNLIRNNSVFEIFAFDPLAGSTI
jgi:hypothetical protein